jgi:hypothetical protein
MIKGFVDYKIQEALDDLKQTLKFERRALNEDFIKITVNNLYYDITQGNNKELIDFLDFKSILKRSKNKKFIKEILTFVLYEILNKEMEDFINRGFRD